MKPDESHGIWPPPPCVEPVTVTPKLISPTLRLPWWGYAGFLMNCLAMSGACKFRTAYALAPLQSLAVPLYWRSHALEGTARTALLGLVLSACGMIYHRQLGRSWRPVKLFRRLGLSGVIVAACLLLGLIAVLLVATA